MSRKDQLKTIHSERIRLIKELEDIYLNAFNRITKLALRDGDIAKLSTIFLKSKEGAIKPLEKEIEKPLITKPANKK